MENQPTINIGMLGHVAHGKSSLVRCITGEKTARNDSRCVNKGIDREMTIQVGYSNAKIYQCPKCPAPDCFASTLGSSKELPDCHNCGQPIDNLVKHVSFVDAPGHRSLIKNMISGSAVMDCVIFVMDSTLEIPQIQTEEHLTIAEIIGINNYVAMVQNKMDLIDRGNLAEVASKGKEQIIKFISGSTAEVNDPPIIPVSCSPGCPINIGRVLQSIVERATEFHRPIYDPYPLFIQCIRSFDVNKAANNPNEILGGVLGGTIMKGTLRIGDCLEIRPGLVDKKGGYTPLLTTVTSLYTGKTPLEEARSGGLIGIGTTMDPTFTRSDKMIGMCAGRPGTLPEVTSELTVKVRLLHREITDGNKKGGKTDKLSVNEVLSIAVGSGTVRAFVKEISKSLVTLKTEYPVCPIPGQTIPLSRVSNGISTIIGKAIYRPDKSIPVSVPCFQQSFEYDQVLTELTEKLQDHENLGKLQLPAIKLGKEGGAKLLWTNFSATARKLQREPQEIANFLMNELATQTSFNERQALIIHGKGKYKAAHLQNVLIKYINKFIKCPVCQSLHTDSSKGRNKKYLNLLCKKCGAESIKQLE